VTGSVPLYPFDRPVSSYLRVPNALDRLAFRTLQIFIESIEQCNSHTQRRLTAKCQHFKRFRHSAVPLSSSCCARRSLFDTLTLDRHVADLSSKCALQRETGAVLRNLNLWRNDAKCRRVLQRSRTCRVDHDVRG
jgi:hypothetical protein